MMHPAPLRRGVALIIALIVLAGLLLLGLPFLFSQSTSLAGSRSFSYHQHATVARESVEQLAIAATAYAHRDHLRAELTPGTGTDDLDLVAQLAASGYSIDTVIANRFAIDGTTSGPAANAVRTGMVISDECAKLDPNHLSVAGWDRLIKQALGTEADWDDGQVWDSEDLGPNDPAGGNDNDGVASADGIAENNGDNDDGDDFGELAGALSELRYRLPGQRITALEQLLLADPGHNKTVRNAADYTGGAGSSGGGIGSGYGFRRPLTRSELELLRPYLSVQLLSPGREGLVDFANAVIQNPQQSNRTVLDSPVTGLYGEGTVLAWDGAAQPTYGMFGSGSSFYFSTPKPYAYANGRGFAISIPPTVNLHQAGPITAQTLAVNGTAAMYYGDLARGGADAPFSRLSPLPPLGKNGEPFELPPIDIGSSGLIGIESSATAHDPLGRQAASRSRRSIAQAVPQEGALERRWLAQDQLYALLQQRFGSALQSWPLPINRVQDIAPDKNTTAAAGTPPIGLSPRTMASWATGWLNRNRGSTSERTPRDIDIDWRMALGAEGPIPKAQVAYGAIDPDGKGNTAFNAPDQQPISTGSFTDADLRPDGLAIGGSGKRLGFTLRPEGGGDHGPLRTYAGARVVNELRARHLSFWLKPDADNFGNAIGADMILPLLEMRMPLVNAGAQADGTAGHNELQNLVGLYYDSLKQCLVLVIAPPIIEHTNDGPLDGGGSPFFRVPPDDRLTTFDLDERCLGNDRSDASILFPKQPYIGSGATGWDEDSALFTSRVSRLMKPNRILTLCRVANTPDPSNAGTLRPFFQAHRWYHVQVVLGGPMPGMTRIIVDGMTGRDVTSTPPTQVASSIPTDTDQLQTGDHLTLPAMPLATAIPMVAVTSGANLLVGDITVTPVLGLTAEDLFPARGMLRIGDEYFLYDSVDNNTFKNCSRSHRQNTNVASTDPLDFWPATQEHRVGDLVVPGGYRLALNQGRIYGGGSRLEQPLANGDPNTSGTHPWTIWSRIKNTNPVTPHPTDPALVIYPANSTTLPLDSTFGVPAQFPPQGIIKIQNQILAYTNNANGTLSGLTDLTGAGWTFAPGLPTFPLFPTWTDISFVVPSATDPAPEVILIGIPLTGANPLDAGRYDVTDNNGYPLTLQLLHPITGRVEWIQYQQLLHNGTRGFILHRQGFGPATRGRERTDFVAKASTKLTPAMIFPAATEVIPVQAEILGLGRMVATGDVVTLLPRTASTTTPPRQLLVRYAAMDGYAATAGNGANDTKNEYFAFTSNLDSMPELIGANADQYDLLVWPGWGGDDLTPQNPLAVPVGAMPRLDLFGPGYAPDQARCLFGAMDMDYVDTTAMGSDAAAWNAARQPDVRATIDALVAGNIEGLPRNDVATNHPGIIRVVRGSTVLIADDIQIGDVIEASLNNFFTTPMGLISIGGETYAWRQPTTAEVTAAISALNALTELTPANSQRFATIIGRGLLDGDLAHAPHGLGLGPKPTSGTNRFLRGTIPAMVLPLGPVAVLESAATDHTFFRMIRSYDSTGAANHSFSDDQLDAPTALVCTPDGVTTTSEIIGLTEAESRPTNNNAFPGAWYSTAPWLRGMYNTPANAAGKAGDLVIGWWPRYPSALPPTANATSQHFRCRQYAWAGFPIAFHQARFDLVPTATGLPTAEIGIQDTAIDDHLTIEVRAAATGMDWLDTSIASAVIPTTPQSAFDASSVFTGGTQFPGKAVSGAELHVTWHYKSDATHAPSSRLDAIAEAGNRAPFLGPVKLRCLAPSTVLAVEEAK